MIARHGALIVALIIFVGCSDTKRDVTLGSTPAPTAKSTADPKPKEPTHHAERLALDFIFQIRHDAYSSTFSEIRADADLPAKNRVAARQKLNSFVKLQDWNLWFTSIDVVDGKEDSVDCYLRGTAGGMLVLIFGYHHDIDQWRLDAYEIPDVTFARPKDESYADYVTRSISESRRDAKPYKNGVQGDGQYFIEYGEAPTPSQQAELATKRPRSKLAAIRERAELAEKITAALNLCGNAESFGVKGPDSASTVEVYSVASRELMRNKLSVGLPIVVKEIPKDASITAKTTKQPALDEVQAILGKEDSTEEDEKESVTWYKYGWCHFGVADDMKVTSVRAD